MKTYNADVKTKEVMLRKSKDVQVGDGKNIRVSGAL